MNNEKNSGSLWVVLSIIIGVCAAVAATLVIIRKLKKKKAALEATNYVFENDFDEDEEYVEV